MVWFGRKRKSSVGRGGTTDSNTRRTERGGGGGTTDRNKMRTERGGRGKCWCQQTEQNGTERNTAEQKNETTGSGGGNPSTTSSSTTTRRTNIHGWKNEPTKIPIPPRGCSSYEYSHASSYYTQYELGFFFGGGGIPLAAPPC